MLADKYCMPSFKNAIVDAMRDRLEHCFVEVELLALLQEYKGLGGKLKELILDQIGYDMTFQCLYGPEGTERQKLHDFLCSSGPAATEILWAYHKTGNKDCNNPVFFGGCHYHEHPEGSPPCSKAEKDDWPNTDDGDTSGWDVE